MSQVTDYVIANASGATVRADINTTFLAVVSHNSGSSEPGTMYAFMLWVDTTNNLIKLRNAANDAWITLGVSITASNTVDINGGAIDATTVGASSASTGAFTTLSTTDNISIGGSNKELRFYEGVNYVGFEAPALSANKIWSLPSADGSADQVLTTNGSGALSWATAAGTTINNNADYRIITGSGTANTLNGIAVLTWDGITFSADGAATFNESGGDVDFRVESDTLTHAFVVDGATGDVFMGQSSQTGYALAQKLVVGDGDDNDGITIQSGATHQGNLAFNHSDGTTAHGRILYQHNTNYMAFMTNNAERIRILAGGGLTFNGDSAAANALDDYEEGTYAPTYTVGGGGSVTGVTSTNIATYTKVGRMVTVSVTSVYVATSGTIPTNYTISLPFTAASPGAQTGGGFGQETGNTGAGVLIHVGNTASTALIWKYDGGAVSANAYFALAFTYQSA
tara:strand:- start:467 stop:1831 length:1365 start_codon:yes stop_codon:yes gene_type:complete